MIKKLSLLGLCSVLSLFEGNAMQVDVARECRDITTSTEVSELTSSTTSKSEVAILQEKLDAALAEKAELEQKLSQLSGSIEQLRTAQDYAHARQTLLNIGATAVDNDVMELSDTLKNLMKSTTVDEAFESVTSDYRLRPLEFTKVLYSARQILGKVAIVCYSPYYSSETGEILKSLGANKVVDDIQQMIDAFTTLISSETLTDALYCLKSNPLIKQCKLAKLLENATKEAPIIAPIEIDSTLIKNLRNAKNYKEARDLLIKLGATAIDNNVQQLANSFSALLMSKDLYSASTFLNESPHLKRYPLAQLLEDIIKDMEDYDRLTDGLEQANNLIELFDACNEYLSPLVVDEIFNKAIPQDGNSTGVAINAMDSEFLDPDSQIIGM